MPESKTSPYDSLPYPRLPFAQSHPDRLATMGQVFGIDPPDIRNCRVLEIGCATGGNLVPMAEQLPGSQFVGFDLSQRQVREANEWIAQLDLKNVKILQLDVADTQPQLGEFDYILCHGVYSWVPFATQDSILQMVARHLSPNGIGYISYNTKPGWCVRGFVRDMMRYHSQAIESPADKIMRSQAWLSYMIQNLSPTDPFGMLIRNEMELLSGKTEQYIMHEYFEDTNNPLYFHEFAAASKTKNLRYLSEADAESTFHGDLPHEVLKTLEQISGDEIRLEQHLDFLRNRTFRQSLVCHSGQPLHRTLDPKLVDNFFLESLLLPTPSPRHFRNRFSGVTLAIEEPALHASVGILAELDQSSWRFHELVDEVKRRSSLKIDEEKLRRMFLQAFASGHMTFHTVPPRYSYDRSGMPQAPRVARSQSLLGSHVTSLSHHNVVLTDLDRLVLQSLDGKTHVSDLSDKVRGLIIERRIASIDLSKLEEAIAVSVMNLARLRLFRTD